VRNAWLAPELARAGLGRLGTVEVVDHSERLLAHHAEADRLKLLRPRAG